MGLLFAKFYNKAYDDNKKTDIRTVAILYGMEIHLLKAGERFYLPGNDDIELYYNESNSQMEISYNNNDNVRFSLENKIVNFMIVEGEGSGSKASIKYPWSDKYNGLRIIQYTLEEYKESNSNILERYMEYRD